MKFKIHYTVNGYEDCLIITGNSIEEIKVNADKELNKRNLDVNKNNVWSEQIS